MAGKKGGWISGAIKKPGALRATAKRHGALENGINKEWLSKAAKGEGVSPKTAQRARLAQTLGKMNKPKKK